MQRLWTMGISALLCSAIGIAVAWSSFSEAAIELGRERLRRGWLFDDVLQAQRERPANIMWLGDSTLQEARGLPPAYPSLIAKRTRGIWTHRLIGIPGLDFFHYYTLTGPLAESRPDAIVFTCNLRSFARSRDDTTFQLLTRKIPPAELPRALGLPLYARDLTLPRMLLDRALDRPAVATATYFASGLRASFQEARAWQLLGSPPPKDDRFEQRQREALLRSYDQEISRSHPVVRMMDATLAIAQRHGVRAIVIVAPVPVRLLRAHGLFAEARYGRRIERLRQVVEARGGDLLDLHAALTPEFFADDSGHYNRAGAQRMSRIVEPHLHRLLAPRGVY